MLSEVERGYEDGAAWEDCLDEGTSDGFGAADDVPDGFQRAVDEEQVTCAHTECANVVDDVIQSDVSQFDASAKTQATKEHSFASDQLPTIASNFSSARISTHATAATTKPP